MTEVKYYPVIDCDCDGTAKAPMIPALSEDTIKRNHSVWLEEIVPHRFRLYSTEDGAGRLKGSFTIRCPYCNSELTQIGERINNTKHGLYVCSSCAGH